MQLDRAPACLNETSHLLYKNLKSMAEQKTEQSMSESPFNAFELALVCPLPQVARVVYIFFSVPAKALWTLTKHGKRFVGTVSLSYSVYPGAFAVRRIMNR